MRKFAIIFLVACALSFPLVFSWKESPGAVPSQELAAGFGIAGASNTTGSGTLPSASNAVADGTGDGSSPLGPDPADPETKQYFSAVLAAFGDGSGAADPPSSPRFSARRYREGEFRVEVGSRTFSTRVAFWCDRRGRTAAGAGDDLRGLHRSFALFLTQAGYTIRKMETDVVPGWVKVLHIASHPEGRRFHFICEAEENRSGSMAYAKVHLCYPPEGLSVKGERAE